MIKEHAITSVHSQSFKSGELLQVEYKDNFYRKTRQFLAVRSESDFNLLLMLGVMPAYNIDYSKVTQITKLYALEPLKENACSFTFDEDKTKVVVCDVV